MAINYIHDTLTAVRQPWLGGAYGDRYARQIVNALDGKSRFGIEQALSLGNYLIHNQGNKEKRAAIRAVLLAELTVRGKPLHQRNSLYHGLKNRQTAQLVADFRSAMGVIWDNQKRLTWAPHNFTDPTGNAGTVLQTRQDWRGRQVPGFRFLIHSLLAGDRLQSSINILQNPGGTLSGWDAVSCSVISDAKPQSYGDMGLILRVSERNILTTSWGDQQFQNHIGTANGRTPGEATGGLRNQGLLREHVSEKNAEYGGLLSPAEILHKQGTAVGGNSPSQHSEVVVVGRPGVDFGAGSTSAITVLGLFRRVTPEGKRYLGKWYPKLARNAIQVLENAAQTLNIPLLHIPDPTSR